MTTVADGAGGHLIKACLQWYGFGHSKITGKHPETLKQRRGRGRVYFDNDSNVKEILV